MLTGRQNICLVENNERKHVSCHHGSPVLYQNVNYVDNEPFLKLTTPKQQLLPFGLRA